MYFICSAHHAHALWPKIHNTQSKRKLVLIIPPSGTNTLSFENVSKKK